MNSFINIIGFDDYQINNIGEVYSNKRNILLKPCLNTAGYLIITLHGIGFKKHPMIHRLVAQHFLSNPLNLPEVNHKDGNKLNNNVDNLEWCTAKENTNHAEINGLRHHVNGEKHGRHKLTQKQVDEIRSINGLSQQQIAEMFGVARQTIQKILTNKKWKKDE